MYCLQNLSMMVDDQSGERSRRELAGVVEDWTERLQEFVVSDCLGPGKHPN